MRSSRLAIVVLALAVGFMAANDVVAQRPGGGGGRPGPGGGGGFGEGRGQGRGGFGGGRRGGGDFMQRMMESLPIIAALDADKDGEISESEITNAVAALKTLDKNADGKLTREEILPAFRGPGGPGGFPGGPGRPGGGPDPELMAKRIMEMDKDGDKKVSKDELPERMQPMFARADANEDGFLTQDELLKMFESADVRRGGRGRGGFGDGGPGGDPNRPQRPQRPQ